MKAAATLDELWPCDVGWFSSMPCRLHSAGAPTYETANPATVASQQLLGAFQVLFSAVVVKEFYHFCFYMPDI